MKNVGTISAVLIVVAVGLGFVGGMKFQEAKSQTPQTPAMQNNTGNGTRGGGRFGRGGGAGGGRPTAGEIISSDDKSATVKLMDGSSKIILLTDKTTINKTIPASKSDLKQGERIAVFGTDNTDGSVTATNISLNPMFSGNNGRTP